MLAAPEAVAEEGMKLAEEEVGRVGQCSQMRHGDGDSDISNGK